MEEFNTPYLLSELPDITSIISYPLQCTQRIKYTCFDVSKGLLVFGATSGGLYVFNREPCSFVQLIPNKNGAITQIKISPDEKCVSFATGSGIVCVCDCGAAGSAYMKSPVLQTSKEHKGNEVTAMIWSHNGNELYISDDIGTISVLHISKFITKNVFQTSSFTLMHLDSRVVQMDVKENMLLASTLTRSFICDTSLEQYRQIGQKLRDGEFGSCFFYSSNEDMSQSPSSAITNGEKQKTNRAFNAIQDGEQISNCDKWNYIKVYAARPGSRLWEVKMDGTVLCTHQFKHLLAIPPTKVVTVNDFDAENFDTESDDREGEPQSLNFTKIYMLVNRFVFTFIKDGIYIFDPKRPAVVLWSNRYTDIADCRVVDGFIYMWMSNGNFTALSFATVEKFLLKCFVNQKYKLCAQVCALHAASLVESIPSSKKIHLISGLGDKLQEFSENDLFTKVSPVLEEIGKIKRNNGQKLKSGIFVVDNSFLAKAASNDEDNYSFEDSNNDSLNKTSSDDSDSMLFQISPDAMQAIKGFSNSVSDKINFGTKSLKKTWDHLEDKMKKIGLDNVNNEPMDVKTANGSAELTQHTTSEVAVPNNDIIVINRSCNHSKKMIGKDRSLTERDRLIQSIYREIRVSTKIDNRDVIYSLIADSTCDIILVYQLLKEVEKFMVDSKETVEHSARECGRHFLLFISKTATICETIDTVIENEDMCTYLMQAFVNLNLNCHVGIQSFSCECGYPLPSSHSNQMPLFFDIMDIFIEKRWISSQSEQCYDICKKVPYMWRKILVLRKKEDLLNLLLLIIQMLDENLLYSYLPQFTVVAWERAIELLGTLRNSECLNCGRNFKFPADEQTTDFNMLSWDSIGSLMIKSVGCANAAHILRSHSNLIPNGELTNKFFHTCILTKLIERYDGTVTNKLVDTLYEAYKYEDAELQLTAHLQDCLRHGLRHTALPLEVASKSSHWGITIPQSTMQSSRKSRHYEIGMNLEQTLEFISCICPNKDCFQCGLPLESRVLVADGGLWVFSCGHTFHGVCLKILEIKLCPMCDKSR